MAPIEGERAMGGAVEVESSAEAVALGRAAAEERLRVGEDGVEEKVGWEMLIGGVFRALGPVGGVDA